MGHERVVRSTAWSPGPGCHGGCGVKFYMDDGRLVKVVDGGHAPQRAVLSPIGW